MDFRQTHISTPSPSSTISSSTAAAPTNGHVTTTTSSSWWESLSLARSRISLLSSLLPDPTSLSSLTDSDRPALSLLTSPSAYSAVSLSLLSSSSGSPSDPLCHWLYDTYLSSDPHLRLVVLSYIPILSHLYLSLLHSPSNTRSLAGFEAVLLSLYTEEVKSRAGNPVVVTVPDLSIPSLYHTPLPNPNPKSQPKPLIGIISPPLEPQIAVKSTKRACIVGVALDCYFKQITQMPFWSKLDLCKFVADWAGQDCPCKSEFDHTNEEIMTQEMGSLEIVENVEIGENRAQSGNNGVRVPLIQERGSLEYGENEKIREIGENGEIRENGGNGFQLGNKGIRVPLAWEILQPILRILGHCLLAPLNVEEVKEAAGVAVRCIYARASHELAPQAILAARSLIQLDKRAREVERAAAVASASSKVNTPSKARKPEMLLVSK